VTYKPKTTPRLVRTRVYVDLDVQPRTRGRTGPTGWEWREVPAHEVAWEVAREVKAKIERRCDDLPDGATVGYDVETECVCVHCGNDAEPHENGFPECCGKAQEDARNAGVADPADLPASAESAK